MRKVALGLALMVALAGSTVAGARHRTTSGQVVIKVTSSWPCEEDEVLRGAGDYRHGMYDRYRCWNPGW